MKKFKAIPAPFGNGIDESATIDSFIDYVGGKHRLEMLSRIARNSYPMPKFNGQYTKKEVFTQNAKRNGFTQNEIDGYLTFGN